ncbi:MAG TPA: RNB domain-containing ribonuclease [Cellulomonas sp.]
MPSTRLRLAPDIVGQLSDGLARLRSELRIPVDFGSAAQAEAAAAASHGPAAVPGRAVPRVDATDLPLLTIDPAGSMDLDQALHVAWSGKGWRVSYAIADLPAFVVPGGALDGETQQRGTTCYGPDGSVPLHPRVLSEGAASLLADQVRPAALWTIDLDEDAQITASRVEPALVKSRARLSYDEAQAALDGGPDPHGVVTVLRALREVGRRRQARERERGGVSLNVPEQEASRDDDGTWQLTFRALLDVEGWNAQISLLTGIAAASIMLEAGVGVLRTMPPADGRDVARLRRAAQALGIPWPESLPYGTLLERLDASTPAHAAFLEAATSLFRGAGYHAFGGVDHATAPTGDDARHAAIAAPYAHVTAPLRRLVDRYGTEVCLAACAGRPVPEWVLAGLPSLPATMADTGRRAHAYARGGVDLVEAAVLEGAVGSSYPGVVLEGPRGHGASLPADQRRGELMVRDPAILAAVRPGPDGALPVGEPVVARLVQASVAERAVLFELTGPA